MKKIIFAIVAITSILCLPNCKKKKSLDSYSGFSFAHGVLVNSDGIVKPKADYILGVQENLIARFQDSLYSTANNEARNIQKTILDLVSDEVLSNALYLDWIAENSQLKRKTNLTITNNALRWYYVQNIQADPILPEGNENWSKGIKKEIALDLEKQGILVFAETKNGSPKYIEDCLSAGVPVPDQLFSEEWVRLGILQDQILALGDYRELHMYISQDPKGFCISMISHEPGNQEHLDMICFGTQSDNVCFFENTSIELPAGEPIDILDLKGASQEETANGYCISCHPGENPFIVHPQDSVFINAYALRGNTLGPTYNLNGTGTKMYKALGGSDWPKNPPAFENLNSVFSKEKCTTCHHSFYAGRFPDLNEANYEDFAQYCNIILPATLGEMSNFNATMPLHDIDGIIKYIGQIDVLKSACGVENDKGKIIENDFDDDPTIVSAPRIIDPLVQCAEIIYVEGVEKEATVTLFIGGEEVSKIENTDETPPFLEFTNFNALNVGDEVFVSQIKSGTNTTLSNTITVKDYKSIYPIALPQPIIEPNTIYECAGVISVRYDIPGLPLDVMVNGGSAVRAHTYAGYKVVYPNSSPFEIGDEFTAKVYACDEESAVSSAVLAQEAPATIQNAVIDPNSLFPGQTLINITHLTYGTHSTLVNQDAAVLTSFSWPLSWIIKRIPDSVSLSSGSFVAQEICDVKTGEPIRLVQLRPCDEVPVAKIRDPKPGEDFVMIIGLIPGARTHIYDANGNELGDSSLGVVQLTRELNEDELIIAFLQIGDCISPQAIQYKV